MTKSPPICSSNNYLLVLRILRYNDHELMSPVPETLSYTSKQEPVHVFGELAAVGMHDVADDFVVEEGLVPDTRNRA